jgi:hypothetical protein
MTHNKSVCDNRRYVTLPHAAKLLGIPISTLRRAESAGLVHSYTLCSTRKRVILSEVEAAIAANSVGGRDNE